MSDGNHTGKNSEDFSKKKSPTVETPQQGIATAANNTTNNHDTQQQPQQQPQVVGAAYTRRTYAAPAPFPSTPPLAPAVPPRSPVVLAVAAGIPRRTSTGPSPGTLLHANSSSPVVLTGAVSPANMAPTPTSLVSPFWRGPSGANESGAATPAMSVSAGQLGGDEDGVGGGRSASTSPEGLGRPLESPVVGPVLTPTNADTGAPAGRKTRLREADRAFQAGSAVAALPPGALSVPLAKPRYERRHRTQNHIAVASDAATTTDDNNDDSTSAVEGAARSTSDVRSWSATERLVVRNGPFEYQSTVDFHNYALFRHGRHKIVARSVGYASDGDLVLHREDVEERSDNVVGRRLASEIHEAVCLDPKAKRPMTDVEEEYLRQTKQINQRRHRKYPGVKAPRNKRIQNRLANDSLATSELFKSALERAEHRLGGNSSGKKNGQKTRRDLDDNDDESSSSGDEDVHEKGEGTAIRSNVFGNLPPRFKKLIHADCDKQTAYLEKCGVSPVVRPAVVADPNAPDVRFGQLDHRLQRALKDAMKSAYLTNLIGELDMHFRDFIQFAPPEVGVQTPPMAGMPIPTSMPAMGGEDDDDVRMDPLPPPMGQDSTSAPSAPSSTAAQSPISDPPTAAMTFTAGGGPPRVPRQLTDQAPPPLTFELRDAYGRIVCHAVASYYRLQSASEDHKTDDQRRQTLVSFPTSKKARAATIQLPHTPLLAFLQRGRSTVPQPLSGAGGAAVSPLASPASAPYGYGSALPATMMGGPTLTAPYHDESNQQPNNNNPSSNKHYPHSVLSVATVANGDGGENNGGGGAAATGTPTGSGGISPLVDIGYGIDNFTGRPNGPDGIPITKTAFKKLKKGDFTVVKMA